MVVAAEFRAMLDSLWSFYWKFEQLYLYIIEPSWLVDNLDSKVINGRLLIIWSCVFEIWLRSNRSSFRSPKMMLIYDKMSKYWVFIFATQRCSLFTNGPNNWSFHPHRWDTDSSSVKFVASLCSLIHSSPFPGLSAALVGVMGSRFKKSGKLFPAGVVSLVSLVMTGGYLHGILRSLHWRCLKYGYEGLMVLIWTILSESLSMPLSGR